MQDSSVRYIFFVLKFFNLGLDIVENVHKPSIVGEGITFLQYIFQLQ